MKDEQTPEYCPSCGSAVGADARFCSHCGAPLHRNDEQFHDRETHESYSDTAYDESAEGGHRTTVDEYLHRAVYFFDQTDYIPNDVDEDVFIYENIPHYRRKFESMRTLQQRTSWCWPAFLFGPAWMLYRKMYGCAMGTMLLAMVLGVLGKSSSLLNLCLMVGTGLFGNYLYMCTVQARVTKMRAFDPRNAQIFIEKYKGTSVTGLVIGIFLLIAVAVMWTVFLVIGALAFWGLTLGTWI